MGIFGTTPVTDLPEEEVKEETSDNVQEEASSASDVKDVIIDAEEVVGGETITEEEQEAKNEARYKEEKEAEAKRGNVRDGRHSL
jgi:hypothetical protein